MATEINSGRILTKEQLAGFAGFTDGPWVSVQNDVDVDVRRVDEHGEAICQAFSWDEGYPVSQNAALIAAAPDLLSTALHLYAEVERLTEESGDQDERKADAHWRAQNINAPEDAEVRALCERVGYGAVMDAASRLWIKNANPVSGAFYIGGCVGPARTEASHE